MRLQLDAMTKEELIQLMQTAYDGASKETARKSFAEEFNVPYKTLRGQFTRSRSHPDWVEPVLRMKLKLMEYENGNAKPDGAASQDAEISPSSRKGEEEMTFQSIPLICIIG